MKKNLSRDNMQLMVHSMKTSNNLTNGESLSFLEPPFMDIFQDSTVLNIKCKKLRKNFEITNDLNVKKYIFDVLSDHDCHN